ncbi:MAG TPA: hypothetical protein VH415_07445 [Nitrososphaeraceae archaeon]|jgi:hypothetical protein
MQTKVEKLIEEYGQDLQDAANAYSKIMKLLKTLNNDYSLKITTRLTSLTINFKNRIDQSVVD